MMKRLLVFLLLLGILLLPACGSEDSITLYFAEGASITLEEREFPEVGKHYDLDAKPVIRDFYLYVDPNTSHLYVTFRQPVKNQLQTYEGMIVGSNFGEFGGEVVFTPYYARQVFYDEKPAVVSNWHFDFFVHTSERGHLLQSLQNECYLFTSVPSIYPGFAITRIWKDKETRYTKWEEIYREDCNLYGGVWSDALYFITDHGLYRLDGTEATQLSKLPEYFWWYSYITSVALYEGSIYAVAPLFGIYRYDIATGEEFLYSCEGIEELAPIDAPIQPLPEDAEESRE